MNLVVAVAIVFALLVLNEYWWRKHSQPNELSRKFVHITIGSFVAFWPFFLTWNQIVFLSGAFLVTIIASKYLGIFKAIHSVQRPTWGEIFFAVAVGLIAMVTHSKGIYAVALLHMSLADGLAAIVGLRFGTGNRYKLLGNTKSVAGTLTFFVVSVTLLAGYSYITGDYLAVPLIIGLALGTSLIENLGVFGLDNLFVPLAIAYMLSL